MPLIEAKVQRGALSDDQLDDLAARLTEVASDAEGSDLDRAKPVTWVTVDEYDRAHWQVGGERSDNPRYLIHAHLAEGLADEAGKDHLVSGMTDAVREVVGEDAFVPMACWVVVDEVESRHWGAGGSRLSSADIANVVGAEMARENEQRRGDGNGGGETDEETRTEFLDRVAEAVSGVDDASENPWRTPDDDSDLRKIAARFQQSTKFDVASRPDFDEREVLRSRFPNPQKRQSYEIHEQRRLEQPPIQSVLEYAETHAEEMRAEKFAPDEFLTAQEGRYIGDSKRTR